MGGEFAWEVGVRGWAAFLRLVGRVLVWTLGKNRPRNGGLVGL